MHNFTLNFKKYTLPKIGHAGYCWIIEGRMKGRPTSQEEERGCRCYTCWQKMVMWQRSEKLETGGNGIKESHVKNLLHSRTPEREKMSIA